MKTTVTYVGNWLKNLFIIAGLTSLMTGVAVASESHGADHGHGAHGEEAAHGHASAEESEDVDITEVIGHHISDGHDWHIIDINDHPVSVPLPVILYSSEKGLDVFLSSKFQHNDDGKVVVETKAGNRYVKVHEEIYFASEKANAHGAFVEMDEHHHPVNAKPYDVSLTKDVAEMLLGVSLMLVIFISVANGAKKREGKAPRGIQSFFEPLILFVRDEIAIPNIGKKHHERFMPFLLTVFFFIWINNLLGLLPGAPNLTGNIAVTLTLAVFTLVITVVNGNKNYWLHIFATPGVPWWLLPIMVPIEIIGIFTKPFSLMVRLFANITAGHIVILCVIGLIFMFKSAYVGVASVPFGVFMNALELLVAFLQAFVFTLLSAIYFGSAVEEGHH